MNSFSTRLKIRLIKLVLTTLSRLSLRNCHRVGSAIGQLAYLVKGKSRRITEKNIQLCFPQLDSSSQQTLVHQSLLETGKTLAEAGPMWLWNKDRLFSLIKKVHGEDRVQKALQQNKGVIIALPHLGNWELLGLYCSANYPTTSLYRVPRMAQLDTIVKTGRERLGAKLVPTNNQGIRALYKALRDNELTCILPDQEPPGDKGNGVFAPFFGIQTYSMTLLSRLAQKTQADIIIGYTKRLPGGKGYEIFFDGLAEDAMNQAHPPSLEASVTVLNAGLEKSIRQIPEQYQWGYKRFRTRPQGEEEFYND